MEQNLEIKQTQLTILSNKNILEITNVFTDSYSVFKRATKQEDKKPNILSINEQLMLIQAIINNLYNISKDGKDCFLLDVGNGDIKYVEKNLKNFISILRVEFPKLYTSDDFENIKISELFEHLKSRKSYEFREYRSPFFDKSEFIVDEKNNALISHIKIDFKHDLDAVTKEMYDEIVTGICEHWQGKIPEILDYIVASTFVVDKKNLWLLIMADSNFGKSKIFEWMKEWDGSAFIHFEDVVNTGINNRKPEDYYNKKCLVIDEVMGMDRKLFKIEGTLEIRPMRAHTVYVPINSRILLSADGGKFNDEYQDKQITNRVSEIDFRFKNIPELGDLPITKKYGKNNIKRVMSHWLHCEITKRDEFYASLEKNKRADEAEKIVNTFSQKYKMDKMDFFQMVEVCMNDIIKDFKTQLGSKFYDEIEDFIIEDFSYKKQKGVIIKSPASILERILVKYNKTLQYELQFKKIPQMVEKIVGWHYGSFEVEPKKGVKGLFIPYKCEILMEKPDGTIIDLTTGKELF